MSGFRVQGSRALGGTKDMQGLSGDDGGGVLEWVYVDLNRLEKLLYGGVRAEFGFGLLRQGYGVGRIW